MIAKDELVKLLNDYSCPIDISNSVDQSHTAFSESNFLEASLILQRMRLHEKDFYFNFKQDASVVTTATSNDKTVWYNNTDIFANETNREVFFTTMCDVNKDFWSKSNYYRAFQLANLYVYLGGPRQISATIFIDKLANSYELVVPKINMAQRKNYIIYKSLPREIYIDLLAFLAIENFQHKTASESASSNQLINETQLKIMLNDFGMKFMPDTVIDLAKKGYDSLRRRLYYPLDVIKYIIIADSVAAEQMRTSLAVTKYGLKVNNDSSRNFNTPPRKFLSSPLV